MNQDNFADETKSILIDASNKNLKVMIEYRSLKDEVTERIISNIEFTEEFDKFGYYGEHIKAYCHLRDDERHFKIDRIISIKFVENNYVENWVKNKRESVFIPHKQVPSIGHGKFVQPQKSCFIATCIYGVDASETLVLRAWRDDVLVKSCFGRIFIRKYYKFSPSMVVIIQQCNFIKMLARKVLDRIVWYALRRI